jgi:hypothetical protein
VWELRGNERVQLSGRAPSPICNLTSGTPARSKRKLIAFGWYGGKFSHLNWLLPPLPACHHYCEPFEASAAVLLNRVPSPVETFNVIDGDVANFFGVLRLGTDSLAARYLRASARRSILAAKSGVSRRL